MFVLCANIFIYLSPNLLKTYETQPGCLNKAYLFTVIISPSKQDCSDTIVIMAWPFKICLTGIHSERAPGCPHREVYPFKVLVSLNQKQEMTVLADV